MKTYLLTIVNWDGKLFGITDTEIVIVAEDKYHAWMHVVNSVYAERVKEQNITMDKLQELTPGMHLIQREISI